MNFDLKKVLLEICDNNSDVLGDDVNLIEDGYLDSYAFIELFEALQDAQIDISPTEITMADLKNYNSLNKVVEEYIKNNKNVKTR